MSVQSHARTRFAATVLLVAGIASAVTSSSLAAVYVLREQDPVTITAPATSFVFDKGLELSVQGGSGSGVTKVSITNNTAGCRAVRRDKQAPAVLLSAKRRGTCTVSVSRHADAEWAAVQGNSLVFQVHGHSPAAVSIASSLAESMVGHGVTLTASGGPGRAQLVLHVRDANVCTAHGLRLTMHGAGTCLVTGTAPATDMLEAVTTNELTIHVRAKAAAQLSMILAGRFPAILGGFGAVTVQDQASLQVSGADAGYQGGYRVESNDPAVCKVVGSGTSLNVLGVGVGVCTIHAAADGDSLWRPKDSTLMLSVLRRQQAAGAVVAVSEPLVPGSAFYPNLSKVGLTGGSGSGQVRYYATDSTSPYCLVDDLTGKILVYKGLLPWGPDTFATCEVYAVKLGDGTYESMQTAPFKIVIGLLQ